jgi:hypothetical protein
VALGNSGNRRAISCWQPAGPNRGVIGRAPGQQGWGSGRSPRHSHAGRAGQAHNCGRPPIVPALCAGKKGQFTGTTSWAANTSSARQTDLSAHCTAICIPKARRCQSTAKLAPARGSRPPGCRRSFWASWQP